MSLELEEGETDFINRLPGDVRSDLFGHYIGLHLKIRLELELLGITVFGLDCCDDNYWLETRFDGWEQLERFLELVECDRYPSGVQWDVEECFDDVMDAGLALFIPRMDLHVVYRMLKRLSEATVSDAETQNTIKEHEQRLGKAFDRWGE